MFSEDNAFDVVDEVLVGDLTEVKEEKQLIPPAKGVKLLVKKVESKASEDNTYRWLNLHLQLVEGIGGEGAYRNKVVFGKVCYYADMEKYGGKEFFKKKQHLIQLKNLLKAVSADLATVKINDAFLNGLVGQYVLGDITQTKGNEEYGPDNEVKNYKEVSANSMV